jgi:hypothetical protein
MNKTVPPVVDKLEKRRQIKVERTRESRRINGRKGKFNRESGTDRHYGPQSQKPDLPDHVFEQLRKNQLDKLLDNGKNWKQIEQDTRGQSESGLWLAHRQEMLTSSNFGDVCRMRPTTSCATMVKNILYPPIIDTAAMKYGRDQEEVARRELAAKLNKNIKPCGLFIDKENPYLGTSPDGLIDEDGLVEIKCPLSAEHLTAEDAIEKLPGLKSIFNKRNPNNINQNHKFFYQIQGQLNITQRQYCKFAVWTPKSMKIVHVVVDNAFWKTKMLPFLTRFYYECMLPEIVDSRYNRHMPIRNPKYIIEAKEEAAKKVSVSKNSRQKAKESENVSEKKKRIKLDVSPRDTIISAVVTAVDTDEDDDCVIVSYTSSQDINGDNTARWKVFLNENIPDISQVKDNVLPKNSELNDESLDRFLRVVRETSPFETQNVLYIAFPDMIEASRSDKSLQIIGGNCSGHWRCLFFDGSKLHVYDSLPGCTYDKLVADEKYYIQHRYPTISQSDIIYEQVDAQPDAYSCGIYAAAFATTVALGGNPCNERYSINVRSMREHFIKIIEDNKLLPFPSR